MGQTADDQGVDGVVAMERVPGGPVHLAPPVREVLDWSREDRIAYARTSRASSPWRASIPRYEASPMASAAP